MCIDVCVCGPFSIALQVSNHPTCDAETCGLFMCVLDVSNSFSLGVGLQSDYTFPYACPFALSLPQAGPSLVCFPVHVLTTQFLLMHFLMPCPVHVHTGGGVSRSLAPDVNMRLDVNTVLSTIFLVCVGV